jgi:type I restriction enzyme S subunit
MTKVIALEMAASYVTTRVAATDVMAENFVSVENLLPNRAGLTTASGLPPAGGLMPAYMPGDILVGNIRPYLKKLWYADRKGGCSNDVLVIRAKHGYDSTYLYYALLRDEFFAHMMNGKKGTKMPRGDKKQIMRFPIPEVQYSVQVEIASVLSALDTKIALNTRINAELEALAKLIYDYWFVQFDFPNAKGQPYKSSGGAMVHNQELKREVPEGWEVTELRKYIGSNRGHSYTGADIGGQGRPMINLNSFNTNSTYKVEGLKMYSGAINPAKVLEPFDLVMCNTQQTALDPAKDIIGKSLLVPDIFDQEIVSSADVTTVNVKKKNLKYYLNSLFNSDYFHRHISGYCSGSNILHLNFEGVLSFRTAIPDDGLLKAFGAMAQNFEERKSISLKENQELTALRDWLLPLLMNGQVVVGEAVEKVGLAMAAEAIGHYGKKRK